VFSRLTGQRAYAVPVDGLSMDFHQGLRDTFVPADFRLMAEA